MVLGSPATHSQQADTEQLIKSDEPELVDPEIAEYQPKNPRRGRHVVAVVVTTLAVGLAFVVFMMASSGSAIDKVPEASKMSLTGLNGGPVVVKKSEMYGGGRHLRLQDDYRDCGEDCLGIKQIEVHCGSRVGKIIVTYKSEKVRTYGKGDGGAHNCGTFHISGGNEYINKIKVWGTNRVSRIQFFTNHRRASHEYGGDGGNADRNPQMHVVIPPEGWAIASFKGHAGGEVDGIGFTFMRTPSACNAIKRVTGEWVPDQVTNGALTREISQGTTREDSSTRESAWSNALSIAVAAGYSMHGASVEVEVSQSYSKSGSQSYAKAFSMNTVKTQSIAFSSGGQLWKWVFHTVDPCGSSDSIQDYVMTRNKDQPPCCPVGWAKDAYAQFGPCAGATPVKINACDVETIKRNKFDFGVQMQDSDVLDVNHNFWEKK